MGFSDTLKIVQRDLSGIHYAGKSLRKSDVITIDQRIHRIVFRTPLDIKAINFASGTEVILTGNCKIVHIMASGRLISLGNLFCGSIEAGGDIIVRGDLSTWLGDAETVGGSIFVSGDMSCAGRAIARNGCIVVNGEMEAHDDPDTPTFWEGVSGGPLPPEARGAASAAGRAVKSAMGA